MTFNPFSDNVYCAGRWSVYRQDAGMGEKDYCVLRNDEFFCRTDSQDTAMLIIDAVDAL